MISSFADAFAGSYGGFLAFLWRIHYPDEIYAAIPASGPTKGLISNPKDPLASAMGDWVSCDQPFVANTADSAQANMVYSDASAQAVSIIQQGTSSIRAQLKSGKNMQQPSP